MKTVLFMVSVSFLINEKSFGQAANVPSVIVLYPNEIETDSLAAVELKSYEQERTITDDFRKKFVHDRLAPNWKTIRENELAFMEKEDFFSLMVLGITHALTDKEVENRSSLLIYPVKERQASSLITYKKIADQYKMSWVVNVPKAEAYMADGKRKLVITVQLYNVVQPRLFLDKKFAVDSFSLNDPNNCAEIWPCLSEQIVHHIVTDLVDKIERNIRLSR